MKTEWTDQTAFDAAYVHCMEQKVRAVNSIGDCKYRELNGTKCAVGCLIPDDLYSRDMEGWEASKVFETLGWSLGKFIFNAVQVAHDTLLDPDDLSKFHNEMKEIAEKYGLEWNHG